MAGRSFGSAFPEAGGAMLAAAREIAPRKSSVITGR
jgi:hypothetical protein